MWQLPAAIVLIILIFFLCHYTVARVKGRGLGAWVGFISMGAPDFWEYMPEDDNRLYDVGAGIVTPYGNGFPRETATVRGAIAAYVKARQLGISVESNEKMRNPRMSFYADRSYPNSIGVYWEMTPKEKEND